MGYEQDVAKAIYAHERGPSLDHATEEEWREAEMNYLYGNKEGENVSDDLRITGTELAGETTSAADYIKAIETLFELVDETEYSLSELQTFEQVNIGTYIRKYKLMQRKQRKYGRENITEGGLPGLVTRLNDKVKRAKNMVGSPDDQITALKKRRERLDDDAPIKELVQYVTDVDRILFPDDDPTKDESLEDTFIDAGNYGDIGYQLRMGAFGKPMQEDL